ncbi:cell division cycle protein 16 homolog [Condylostylus longicornis]|uniref:cell division cycle protein 16 homolog n=1 Tax=Condylostylus longicornis TaxID=2530218 RepID=UPI00244DD2E2|nr:cell division cycle protein 16 homolog [Condylostylus longicornis]
MTGDSEMRNNSIDGDDYIDLDKYRKLVRHFIDMRRYQTALFWAEKVAVISQYDASDLYWQAQCLFLSKEYHRSAHIIKNHGLEKTNLNCYYLIIESLFEAKEYTEALAIINNIDMDELMLLNNQSHSEFAMDDNKNCLLASICFLKGKIFEAMDNRSLAMDYYVQALQKSIYCTEALDSLVQHEMLMAWEEKELVQHIPFNLQCSESDTKLIRKMYECKLKKYYDPIGAQTNAEQTPNTGNFNILKSIKTLTDKAKEHTTRINPNISKVSSPLHLSFLSPANKVLEDINKPPHSLHSSLSRVSILNDNNRTNLDSSTYQKNNITSENPSAISLSLCMNKIKKSTDMMATQAERLFYDCKYRQCQELLNGLLKEDPYHNDGLTVLIGCLVELGDSNKLFYIAHKLVDRYPEKAISWYAVGCYYDLIGKSDPARRYLSKATSLDRLYGPAWLAYGHSFAKENEHDQAMAAYFKATQLMRGCHLPLLYIGVECGLTKNLELAEKFFYQAMSIAPLDVFVLHELGVIKYEYEYYESAEEVFRTTAEIITNRAKQSREEISPRWEPLFNNLGHCCRKNKKYKEALEYHQLALLLKPSSSETYTAIGFIHALMGNLEEAIEYFHKSLSIFRDCVVTSTILKTCIEDLMEQECIIDSICDKDLEKTNCEESDISTPGTPLKLNCMKLKYDDVESSPAEALDISMDT